MIYRVYLPNIEPIFYNCWKNACNNLPKNCDGVAVEKYFDENHSIKLIPIPTYSHKYVGKQSWGWSHIEFKTKDAYVLFMLEWS